MNFYRNKGMMKRRKQRWKKEGEKKNYYCYHAKFVEMNLRDTAVK